MKNAPEPKAKRQTQPEKARELAAKGHTDAEIAAALGVTERTAARYIGRLPDIPWLRDMLRNY